MAALPNAMQNAKTDCVGFTPYPLTIALPYSRGGRSETQHNPLALGVHIGPRKAPKIDPKGLQNTFKN